MMRRLLLCLLVLAPSACVTAEGVAGSRTVPVVEEDSPGWDCSTMGNRRCGL